MQLGETIATYDVDLALRGEAGKFEVMSPNGEIYYVTCRSNRSVTKADSPTSHIYPRAFLVKKIAEPIKEEDGSETNSAALLQAPPSSVPLAPYLLENREDAGELSPKEDGAAAVHGNSATSGTQIWRLELSYCESNAETQQPCAFVYVRSEQASAAQGSSEKLMTIPCASFNQLDAEVRKLHAQLDEIALRAKKNFYKAYAAAASA